ncbi:MAG: NAD(P)H-dependent oxidoreductase [Anaerolineaceae bacterium]|nr:NAD(P)H-dependent oxidoreductase [Anaerolineaceae bacterium]
MKLTIYSGSGRGAKSNTALLMKYFISGFETVIGNKAELIYLSSKMDAVQSVDSFLSSDAVMIAFPLYIDAMPGMVKAFIESLRPYCGRKGNPKMAYCVHSGFPEPLHSRYVERYLEKLSARLGCEYAGTIVRGGTEGIQIMSEKMTRKLFATMEKLGENFGQKGVLDVELLDILAGSERYPAITGLVLPIMTKLGMTTGYWDQELKKNNAFDKRNAKPYA